MKICTFNINGINARLPNLLRFLKEDKPDVVLLQEIKCMDEKFPTEEIEELGYNIQTHGQKSFNGVAILSKHPIDDVTTGLNYQMADGSHEQARYIEAVICGDEAVRVASVYVVNGSEVGTDKWEHKMRFFDALKEHLGNLKSFDEKIVIGGDFNVAPYDIDVYAPDQLRGSVCFHAQEQAHFNEITNNGWLDCWREVNPAAQAFSWWDYRAGAYQHNKGLRIDFLLCNPLAMNSVKSCDIIEHTRGWEKPSDHAPVMLEL